MVGGGDWLIAVVVCRLVDCSGCVDYVLDILLSRSFLRMRLVILFLIDRSSLEFLCPHDNVTTLYIWCLECQILYFSPSPGRILAAKLLPKSLLTPSFLRGNKMELVKELRECLHFIFTAQFWRMAVLWTAALIFSHLKLFSSTFLLPKSKHYSHRSLKDCISASAPVTRPICIITGATSGLGAAAAFSLSKEGFYVVLAGRSPELLSKVTSDIKRRNNDACLKAFQVDITSFESILKFKCSLQQWLLDSNMHSSIQLLINNAGILATSCRLTSEGYDQMITTNYIGAFCLTKVLLPLLENSIVPSRVVNVTSFTHWSVLSMQVDRGTMKCFSKSKCYPFAHIYEYSKLCLLLFSYELHRQVGHTEKSHKLSVVAVDPGAVKTNIMREIPSGISQLSYIVLKFLGLLQSPENAVCSILDAALAPPEVSGVYFFGGKGRTLNSSALSYDARLSKDLWDTSCNLFRELHLAAKDT